MLLRMSVLTAQEPRMRGMSCYQSEQGSCVIGRSSARLSRALPTSYPFEKRRDMPEPIELDVSSLQSRRGSAVLYVAHMCYPDDERTRGKFFVAVSAEFFKFLRDEHQLYVQGLAAEVRAMVSNRACKRALRKAEKILIEKRIPVSRHIAGAVGAMRLGYPGDEPRNLITAIEEHALRVGRDADNVRQREWYPTRPVAHLTLGFLVAVDWDRYQSMSLMEFMLGPDPVWVEKAINFSNKFLECLICANVISDNHSPIVIHAKDPL